MLCEAPECALKKYTFSAVYSFHIMWRVFGIFSACFSLVLLRCVKKSSRHFFTKLYLIYFIYFTRTRFAAPCVGCMHLLHPAISRARSPQMALCRGFRNVFNVGPSPISNLARYDTTTRFLYTQNKPHT